MGGNRGCKGCTGFLGYSGTGGHLQFVGYRWVRELGMFLYFDLNNRLLIETFLGTSISYWLHRSPRAYPIRCTAIAVEVNCKAQSCNDEYDQRQLPTSNSRANNHLTAPGVAIPDPSSRIVRIGARHTAAFIGKPGANPFAPYPGMSFTDLRLTREPHPPAPRMPQTPMGL